MSFFQKFILALCFAIAFFVPVWFLGLGIVVGILYAVFSLFSGDYFLFFIPLVSALGAVGFWGICQLLAKTLDSAINIASPKRLRIYLCLGIVSLSVAATIAALKLGVSGLFCLLPFLVTLFLVNYHRAYLTSK